MRFLAAAGLTVLLTACASSLGESKAALLQPEAASGYTDKPGWATQHFSVAAAHPLATDAGYKILKAGGSAVDAAIAVQMVLSLVEPQSSGIGGGSFLLHHDGQRNITVAFDGRETAPAAANENLFLKPDGKPVAFFDGVVGGRAVGVPGTVQMLENAHRQHGKLTWATLLAPAIELAEQGFKVSERLHSLLVSDVYLHKDPVAAAYFYDTASQPWPVGHVLKNPELANVFKRIAAEGAEALMTGDIAQAIVEKVRQHPTNPGQLALADLADYRAIQRQPLCHDYRVAPRDYRICGMPPPSSGAIAIGQMLSMLSHTPAATMPLMDGLPDARWLHLYTEASRLAFADRDQYIADPDFVQPPGGHWMSMLEPHYLAERARLIGPVRMTTVLAGTPGAVKTSYAPMPEQPEHGTSHISIVDGFGNALAMTSTIENAFGSRQMVKGFLLNNELTDFSFTPSDAQGRPIANRVEPGKRPRSSMAPTLVFDKATGELLMSGGSPGGALIIHYTVKLLYGTLNWKLDAQQAINLPNFGSLNGMTLLEERRFPVATVQSLQQPGAQVREVPMTSGLQAIQRTPSGWFGGADPRREGIVRGD
ncbi:MAG: Gamma-glutamyltranspeptidase precursor [Pseudomonadota bacterium]